MDHWGAEVSLTAGQKSLFPTDPIPSDGQNLSFILTVSPMDVNYVLSALNLQKPTGWALGRSKGVINSWEMGIQVHNPANVPIKVTLYTLKFKCDQNFEPGISQTMSLRDEMEVWYNSQYGNTSTTTGIEYTAFKFSALSRFTKNLKVVKKSTRVIQPGQNKFWKKYRRKPKLYNTSQLYDSLNTPFIIKRALRGDLHYLWEIEPQIAAKTDGATVTYLTGRLVFLYKIHMRMSYFANDDYSSDATTAMSSAVTPSSIMPTQNNTVAVSWAAATGV